MSKLIITEQEALQYHSDPMPGNLGTYIKKSLKTQRDFSLAYSPGVAFPCKEISKDVEKAYDYTNKGNLVAMVSNGSAVLGLGNIGAVASKPVMEGKAILLKKLAGIDCFDIEIDSQDPNRIIDVVQAISPTFGAINLEDIKAPDCFFIEDTLKSTLNIPIMHDDQHGTAIVSGAALINALELVSKKISEITIVINGAGAAANACANLYMRLGVKRENIIMCDTKGVVHKDRTDLNEYKALFATSRSLRTLDDAMRGADVFLGVSVADVVSVENVKSMADRPIVFALANPDPEISYELAASVRKDVIVATGRSSSPNQVNNVLGFPYIFRGALDSRASTINEEMKLAAVHAIANVVKLPVLDSIKKTYNLSELEFGASYILPKMSDPRLINLVSIAVAKAAMDSGVARKPITDWIKYEGKLKTLVQEIC